MEKSTSRDEILSLQRLTIEFWGDGLFSIIENNAPRFGNLIQLRLHQIQDDLTRLFCPLRDFRNFKILEIGLRACGGAETIDAQALNNLTELEHLALRNHPITDKTLQNIAVHWQKLEYLNLHENTHFKDSGIKHLSLLPNLKRLYWTKLHAITDQ